MLSIESTRMEVNNLLIACLGLGSTDYVDQIDAVKDEMEMNSAVFQLISKLDRDTSEKLKELWISLTSDVPTFFIWTGELDLGIPQIDEQHAKLAVYISDLYASKGRGRLQVGVVLRGLLDYTNVHFRFEEELFVKSLYKKRAEHIRYHRIFAEGVEKYIERFNSGEDVVESLANTLKEWLIGHIKTEDFGYIADVKTMYGIKS